MWRRAARVRTDVSEERRSNYLVSANVVRSSLIVSTLVKKVARSSETSVLTRATRRHMAEDGILHSHRRENLKQTNKQTNSVALSSQTNYTDWSIATCRRNLVPTFVDTGVSRGQRDGSPTVVNLSFLDRSENLKSNKIDLYL
jgi:hypothetical protein